MNITRFLQVGIVGVNIEDSDSPDGALFDVPTQAARIAEARAAADNFGRRSERTTNGQIALFPCVAKKVSGGEATGAHRVAQGALELGPAWSSGPRWSDREENFRPRSGTHFCHRFGPYYGTDCWLA